MKNSIRMALMLATALSAQPALAGQAARQSTVGYDRYVARLPDGNASPLRSQSSTAAASCSADRNPSDPIYFKLADGRCTGQ